ncbi:modulator protein [Iodidimonas gelatinilytica]|uniref:Modulator protein n=1 Tax=Iodidimonas gelatinilytica TaxID=1236966 RepID=A0A5A7MWR9_9PROT|nr:TldD/PmbA family protein [Iodidimonas gelatinilytica]GEQ99904.1 modulator protein [Iodidimonas gelatinilytica]
MTTISAQTPPTADIIADLIHRAKALGADAADALALSSKSVAISYRMGTLEDAERSESMAYGLRVMIGQSSATVSTSDPGKDARQTLVERAIAMAKVTPQDPFIGLADPSLFATNRDARGMDLFDGHVFDEAELTDLARTAEEAARAVDGVTNSGGAGANAAHMRMDLMTSNGFSGGYEGSSYSISASVLAGTGTQMERDYDYSAARHFADLDPAETIGKRAGERAVRRLGAERLPTAKLPVIFDPRVSNSLLGHFAQGVNGASIARGSSFLRDKMGEQVFAPGISVIDAPTRKRGLRSRPFDAEGVMVRDLPLIEDGILQSWVLDCATARKLGLQTTGSAMRGLSSAPSPGTSNLYMAAGTTPVADLIGSVSRGFYVTELIGMGVNPVTGDYSRGAAGFLIENGVLTHPVNEMTIAGNLVDMLARAIPADDLSFRYAINAPTLLIDQMTVAGT